MLSEREARQFIVEYGQQIEKKAYVAATDGNISIRLGNRILITPSGSRLGKLKKDDIIVINIEGDKLEGIAEPSSEALLHLEVYKNRSDIKTVIHTHPINCVTCTICDIKLNKPILPEIVVVLGSVPTLNYGTPGTPEIFNGIENYIEKTDVFLLDRHGAVCIGKDIHEAYNKLEKLEYCASVYLKAAQVDNMKTLTKEQVDHLMEMRKTKYKLTHPVISDYEW